ncbi:hypothetical protein L227DRAFT_581006 [Lentinus tigrinus ALCF2SS1-6]|uniref:Uncharacterized protein n=1 Tax=Lentinus tigrinus ALCF2SS1-6 TaxID=1328759 RepID=A0A5C2RRV2_9APHY|nr:hypothetical protein L227DRAFT_581006 [Lentinus tigrinus ALCF2SS1-6]
MTPVRRRFSLVSSWLVHAKHVRKEELRTLQDSFAEVKTEFVDLDGQSWETATAREMLVDWVSRPVFALCWCVSGSVNTAPLFEAVVFEESSSCFGF